MDLSADFRLRDPAATRNGTASTLPRPNLQREAVYGLTEFYREEIRAARLVAGTGLQRRDRAIRAASADRGGRDRPR